MVTSESKLAVLKNNVFFFREHIEPVIDHFFNYFTDPRLFTSILQLFLCTGMVLPMPRIAVNLPSQNFKFNKFVRGSLRAFLNCLNSLFAIFEGPVFLLFSRVFVYDCTSSLLAGSN